jgi:hypothetical protein
MPGGKEFRLYSQDQDLAAHAGSIRDALNDIWNVNSAILRSVSAIVDLEERRLRVEQRRLALERRRFRRQPAARREAPVMPLVVELRRAASDEGPLG